ncbi:MAG TPA: dienelactone hydrolase family protein [Acidimicrobiales bacterium]|nr:dienelactone hydrolase family protein [Acidimicrobiales bacterium]
MITHLTLPSGVPARLARPASGEPTAGLVIAPDIGGLRPLFDDLCERLADENGWVVCAPEPFPGREDMTLDERMAAVGGLVDGAQVGALVEAADATGADRVGLVGFCMGGMYTLKAAGTGRFSRCVAFYGMIRVPTDWRSDGQGEPLDAVTTPGASPVLAIVGTNDPYTPAGDIDDLEATGAEVVRYEGAEHGFVHDPSRPTHRPDDAADAWRRAIAFLNG